jgi:cyanophycinase-like exopeptidase
MERRREGTPADDHLGERLSPESFEALKKDFSILEGIQVEHAATRPLDAEKRAKFIEQLKNATGIFFSGGDQNRIMDCTWPTKNC